MSPQTRVFSIHSICWKPKLRSASICLLVIGCCHINVFMAGANNNGRLPFHEWTTLVYARRSKTVPLHSAHMTAQTYNVYITSTFTHAHDSHVSKARFPLPELMGHQHGPSTRLVEMRARQHRPCWWVMETGHPLTRAVNSGSGNRALVLTMIKTFC